MKLTTIILLIAIIGTIGTVSAENIYTPIPATTPAPFGVLEITLRDHNTLHPGSELIIISNADGELMSDTISPDGFYYAWLNPGEYDLMLPDGNAGHPEYAHVTIESGYKKIVPFLGHAVSFDPGRLPPTEPTALPTTVPTTEPTVIPTTIPTISPTPSPTPTPLPTLTPLPTPVCHQEKVCTPGYWECTRKLVCGYDVDGEYHSDCCRWIIVPVWHPEKCNTRTVCD